MFSFIASHLVRSFARYAAGSGISEIKSILAGFVMQGFLGFATFFIKSLTLVCRFVSPVILFSDDFIYSLWLLHLDCPLEKKVLRCMLPAASVH